MKNNNKQFISVTNLYHKMTIGHLIFCGILLGISAQSANAASFGYRNNSSTAYISTGLASVKANELVIGQPNTYPVDYKLSHLIWDSRDVAMLTAGLNIAFEKGITLNIEGKFGVTEGDGVMDDYDWTDTGTSDWSDWSHHEDTIVTDSNTLDINVDVNLYGNRKTQLSLLVGYRNETWAWQSRGGDYIYSTDKTTDRIFTGSFTPGEVGISYEQRFKMPYLGLKYVTHLNDWKFNLQYDYSNQVNISTIDNHHLRDFVITNNYEKGAMSAYKISIGYQIYKNFDVFLRYDVQDYEEVRGNTIYSGSVIGWCVNCAGADNSNQTLSVGLSFIY